MKGAYGVFAVTNYWESRSSDVEMKQGKDMADAAKVCCDDSILMQSFFTDLRSLGSGS
jgi:hypothetical protein